MRFAVFFFLLLITGACSRKSVPAPVTPKVARTEDYMDLGPESTLRIVVPLLKSGAFLPTLTEKGEGNTTTLELYGITTSAPDLVGYQISQYAVKDRGSRGVRLVFVSAQATRDGKTAPEPREPTLPFALPRRTEHIRLVYLVRVSAADHNMAIVAAKRVEDLNTFTKRLKENPAVCSETEGIFCAWVPAGVAVRPEKR